MTTIHPKDVESFISAFEKMTTSAEVRMCYSPRYPIVLEFINEGHQTLGYLVQENVDEVRFDIQHPEECDVTVLITPTMVTKASYDPTFKTWTNITYMYATDTPDHRPYQQGVELYQQLLREHIDQQVT